MHPANIIRSLINTDTAKERAVTVTFINVNCFQFKWCASCLYYYDYAKNDDDRAINDTHKTKQIIKREYMLQPLNINKEHLKQQEYLGAERRKTSITFRMALYLCFRLLCCKDSDKKL